MTIRPSRKSTRETKRRKPTRNYRLEYARRIAHGETKGLSRSQARGHARAGERPKASSLKLIDPRRPEERAIKMMRAGSSIRKAAKLEGLTEERLRRYVKENTQAARVGRRWEIIDLRPRQYPLYSAGDLVSPWLSPDEASRAAMFMHGVRRFFMTGKLDALTPFEEQGVTDIKGKFHPFETDPNELYELDARGELNFPEFYKIVA